MINLSPKRRSAVINQAGKVGVLMGGKASERTISLKSGSAVSQALSRSGFDAEKIDWDGKSLDIFNGKRYQSFFIALHGRGGEDGTVQGVLDIMGIPYTGSGVLASALSMDKRKAKYIWRDRGLSTPESLSIYENTPMEVIANLGFPLVIKPPSQGSSIGVSIVKSEKDISAAIALARRYDPEVMAEKYIDGPEYTVPLIRDEPLPVVRIDTDREFYDYAAKYNSQTTRYVCPSGLSESEIDEISSIAYESYRAIGCAGWGRVDFIRDCDGNFQLIELNTVPGMTSHSLVPKSARTAGIDFDQLVTEILWHGLGKRGSM